MFIFNKSIVSLLQLTLHKLVVFIVQTVERGLLMLADANRLAKSFGDLSVVRLDVAKLILGEALFYHREWVGSFFIFTGRRFALLAKVFTKGDMWGELIDEG